MKNLLLATLKSIAYAVIGLGVSGQAQLIGDWQSSTSEGWIDWGNQLSITDPANAAKYSFAGGVVSGYGQSLKITQAGYNQDLAIKLEYTPGDQAAFFNNHRLSFTFSVPDAASAGSSAGYSQLFAFAINATGFGFQNIPWSSANWSYSGSTADNQSGMPNYYFYSGAPARSQTVTLDYSSYLPSITATPSSGWVELIFTSNNGGGAPGYWYMNNVVLSGGPVPEPSALSLLGVVAGFVALRKKARRPIRGAT
jgi:hypothetical protein